MALRFLVSWLLIAGSCLGIERSPWFGNDKELLGSVGYLYQQSRNLAGAEGPIPINTHDSLLHLEFALSPTPEWNFLTRAEAAYTNTSDFFFNEWIARMEKNWLNDIIGDPLSITSQISLIIPTWESLHNVSTPHSAPFEVEAGLSIGKELSQGPNWQWRFWLSGDFGAGSKGSPWLKGELGIEKALSLSQQIRFTAKETYGLGKDALTTLENFSGYGPYAFHAVDLGIRYTHIFYSYGNLNIEYAYRPYAKYLPEKQSQLSLSFRFPISLVSSFDTWDSQQ